MYIYIFFHIIVHHGLSQDSEYPVLYSRALLFIHPIYTSLLLLTPSSQSLPPTSPLHCGHHTSVLYVCESVSDL